MQLSASPSSPPYFLALPEWPNVGLGDQNVDALVPSCKVGSWQKFEQALNDPLLNPSGVELIYRGQRRHEWQLPPTLGRFSDAGVVDKRRASDQRREFRLAMRGRGIGPDLLDEDNELWAYGQHHGLATPLLDWTKSPFVALFFAFADPDLAYEAPNPSRAIYVMNKTAVEALDPELIVQPLRNDHTRLVNQAGLFTLSPLGKDTLVTRIFNLLSELETVDMDDPVAVARYIFKVHIPNDGRRECLGMLRKMNIHHGSLFPDPIGAALYCNEWFASQLYEPPAPLVTMKPVEPPLPTLAEAAPIAPLGIDEGILGILASIGIDGVGAANLARDLAAKFNASASIDWKERPFGSAAVSVEIKKILRMNGIPPERIEAAALSIFEYFKSVSSADTGGSVAPAPRPSADLATVAPVP